MPPQRPAGFVPDGFEPDTPTAAPPASAPASGAAGFAQEFWKRTNPLEAIKGLVSAAGDIPGTVGSLIKADPAFLTQAQEAAGKGDYTTALRKVLSYASMGLGHELDTQADLLQRGQYARAGGAMAGTATNLAGPAVAAKALGGARVPALMANKDAAVTRAVETGRAAGVPIDAATATGNPFVKFAQKTADESLLGSVVGQRARSAQQTGLTRMGEDLAGQAHPTAVSPGQAGAAAQAGGQSAVKAARTAANDAYGRLRTIEANRGIATDIVPVKDAVRSIHARLAQQNALVPLSSLTGEGKAFVTLSRLLDGPDMVPLSVADAALSDLKAMARSKNPDLRTVGQGIAAKAVTELHDMVAQAARSAGPDAVSALTEGRQATIAKYAAADILKRLEGAQGAKGPVTAFRGVTQAADASLGQLRDVLTQTPTAKPLIGRAVLDGLIDSPTMGPDASFKAWQRVGPETKRLLYTPDHLKALDDFFLLRKKIAENPNPSGSGLTVLKGGELVASNVGLTIGLPALSALLHSKAGVALLTRGFRLPGRSTVAMAGYAAELTKAAERAGAPLLTPALAGDRQP